MRNAGWSFEVVDALLPELEPVDERTHQAWVIEILGEIGPAAKKAIPKMRAFLQLQPFYRHRAKEAIEKIEKGLAKSKP